MAVKANPSAGEPVAPPADTEHKSLRWRLQGLDHGVVLPLLSRLPVRMAQRLAEARGRVNARWHRDWAELSVGMPYVAQRTRWAYAQFCPGRDLDALVRERYATISRDEWIGHLMMQGRHRELPLDLAPVRALLEQRPSGRGLVVLTAHFDSVLLGVLGLGLCGATTTVTTSDVHEDPRVHPRVRRLFRDKYAASTPLLRGGSFLHVERNPRPFYQALRRGEVVAVVADLPAVGDAVAGLWLPWFGAQRRLAAGAVRLARATGSAMAALLTLRGDDGVQRWHCSPVVDPFADVTMGDSSSDHASAPASTPERRAVTDNVPSAVAALYAHLEAVIRQHPGRWWGAHLLQDHPVREPAPS